MARTPNHSTPRPAALKRASELLSPDSPPPKTTRDRLIDSAMELFYLHGFHAVGLDRILSEVGISKQAFYKHFESRDDLAVAAIRRRDELESKAFLEQIKAKVPTGDPIPTLLACFDILDTWFTHPDYHGCLFITASMEFPSPSDPIHQAARLHFTSARAFLESLARQASLANPTGLATDLQMLMEAAITHRVATNNNSAARRMKEVAQLLITARLPTK